MNNDLDTENELDERNNCSKGIENYLWKTNVTQLKEINDEGLPQVKQRTKTRITT